MTQGSLKWQEKGRDIIEEKDRYREKRKVRLSGNEQIIEMEERKSAQSLMKSILRKRNEQTVAWKKEDSRVSLDEKHRTEREDDRNRTECQRQGGYIKDFLFPRDQKARILFQSTELDGWF